MFQEINPIEIRSIVREFQTMDLHHLLSQNYIESKISKDEIEEYTDKFLEVYSSIFYIKDIIEIDEANKIIYTIFHQKHRVFQEYRHNMERALLWNKAYRDAVELLLPILNLCFLRIKM